MKHETEMTSLFTIKKSVDPKTGKTQLSITANGEDCEAFVLENHIAKRYIGFNLILQDLEDSLWWIRKAYSLLPKKSKSQDQDKIEIIYNDSTENDKFKTLKAYYFSSIVTYGKCFSSTKERGIKLESNDHVDSKYLTCHETIIEFRNGLVAHAGGVFDDGEVLVAPNPAGSEFHVHPNLWRLDFHDDREVEIGFEELITHVKDNVNKIQQDILDRLLNVEARNAVIEFQRS